MKHRRFFIFHLRLPLLLPISLIISLLSAPGVLRRAAGYEACKRKKTKCSTDTLRLHWVLFHGLHVLRQIYLELRWALVTQ